jgi:hypothetical protein
MSHNVPAVYDGLAAQIRKCVAFPGPTNCGGVLAWEWSEAEWPSQNVARSAYWRRSVNRPVMRRLFCFIFLPILFNLFSFFKLYRYSIFLFSFYFSIFYYFSCHIIIYINFLFLFKFFIYVFFSFSIFMSS